MSILDVNLFRLFGDESKSKAKFWAKEERSQLFCSGKIYSKGQVCFCLFCRWCLRDSIPWDSKPFSPSFGGCVCEQSQIQARQCILICKSWVDWVASKFTTITILVKISGGSSSNTIRLGMFFWCSTNIAIGKFTSCRCFLQKGGFPLLC